MLLATILLVLPVPQTGDVAKSAVAESHAAVSVASNEVSEAAEMLPSMPAPKVDADVSEPGAGSASSTTPVNSSASATGVITSNAGANAGSLRLEPVKVAYTKRGETSAQRKEWYGLLVMSHAAAGFDAWSTRRAVAAGCTEGNPLLRPFANSNAIYVATQVSPAVMDYLGKRMMVSQHGWIRRMWWLPQMAGSGFSIAAGAHNVGMVH